MFKTVAKIDNIELITNGNHVYYTQIANKSGRFKYRQFAGRTEECARKSFKIRVKKGY